MIANKSLHRALESVFEANVAPFAFNREAIQAANSTVNFSEQAKPISKSAAEISNISSIRKLIGKVGEAATSFGSHPDFSHLKTGDKEFHFCASVFVDLKGSTLLARRFDLPRVQLIKDGLLKSAIQIFHAFDGHIQRLQGDAVFAVFCKKGGVKEDAIIDALNAASVLQAFIEDCLNPQFEGQGLPPIAARVGVDFGDDAEVMWSRYGVGDCHEITTTSLHTDLASKLQSRAPSGGVMIGDNIRKYLDLPEEFLSIHKVIRDGAPVDKRYIIKDGDFKYRMWLFEWDQYLEYFALSRSSGAAIFTSARTLSFTCRVRLPERTDYDSDYLSGCGSLPKNAGLRFSIVLPDSVRWDDIKWTVENRGEEAGTQPELIFDMDEHRKKTFCYQATAFLGHHYMRCRVFQSGKTIADERFGIYVRAA